MEEPELGLWVPMLGSGPWEWWQHNPLKCFVNVSLTLLVFSLSQQKTTPLGSGFAFASSEQRQGELQLLLSSFSVVQRRHLAQGDSAQQRKLCQVPFHLDGLLSEHFSSAFLSGGLVEHQLSCLSGYAEY